MNKPYILTILDESATIVDDSSDEIQSILASNPDPAIKKLCKTILKAEANDEGFTAMCARTELWNKVR